MAKFTLPPPPKDDDHSTVQFDGRLQRRMRAVYRVVVEEQPKAALAPRSGNRNEEQPKAALAPRSGNRNEEQPKAALAPQGSTDEPVSLILTDETPSRAFVGHGAACELTLADPLVSRRHFSLEWDERGLHLIDHGSKNGTYVEQVSVSDAWLRGGERIVVGNTTLRVHLSHDESEGRTARDRFGAVLGASERMQRLYPLFDRIAATDLPALLEGEVGTGKELLAESLHEQGARRGQAFFVFDPSRTPRASARQVLCGGASLGTSEPGLIELAHGGTLFFDEVGDLGQDLQGTLLRLLDRGEVQRVGEVGARRVSVRVFASSRRNLEREVASGHFREDLYARLATIRVELPPLRSREGDIPLLAQTFYDRLLDRPERLSAEILADLQHRDWPGNVRELYQAIVRLTVFGDPKTPAAGVAASEGPAAGDEVAEILAEGLPFGAARQKVLGLFERRYVRDCLDRHDGNVSRASASSGLARRYFQLLNARHR